ncbi:MAG: aminotransferase class III-fold pyridoxal phosphate-dependent enzyme [Rhodospirillaceae bacterium]|nr:aminotransferase class III-fold pyridoxal phosphate-dependent enzyme [Rhodospirillaceae bacterium]
MTANPGTGGRNSDLASAVDTVTARYEAANPASRAQYERARKSLPGGNTRTGMFYTPFPLAIETAAGATVTDVDGHLYTDFVGDFSAGLYGHSHPAIREAVLATLDGGMAFGSTSPGEARLAALVCARFPSIEQVRFTTSGTEANVLALATARAVTGRDAIMVFEGGYHGGTIYFGRESAPINLPFPHLIAPYNDPEEAQRLIRENANRLAAVLVEPLQGASGGIPASAGFLEALREACSGHDVLLIFDEVMTSRLAPGGRQEQLGIVPDMTTLGKYIGGGFSCGAFGGPAEIMTVYDPSRPGAFVHHGTFNNNVFMLNAGAAGLEKVFTPPVQAALNAAGDSLRASLSELAARHGAPFQATGLGSLMNLHLQREPIHSIRDIAPKDPRLRQLLHLDLIDRGFFTTRRGYITLSLAIAESDCAGLIEAVDEFLTHHGHLLDSAPPE